MRVVVGGGGFFFVCLFLGQLVLLDRGPVQGAAGSHRGLGCDRHRWMSGGKPWGSAAGRIPAGCRGARIPPTA